ncbi:hypothetical protein BD410DRAFT_845606 [Rickenella mellea]|uniref:Mixed lineage kinase domain-containing protein n=1 Tax=Rickenella mellea TaxID=50990 RepID=A0A4Y7PI85_9AGAM|nr:hypothetical protein BD410DRAFT_845606 [Rickenella mellea]
MSSKPGSLSIGAAARAATPVALTALVQSADVFPPLKSAVSFLLQVHDICEKMKSNREGADELRLRIEGVRGFVVEAFQDEEDICLELYDALIQFDDALTSILVAVVDVRWRKNRLSRLAFSARDADTLRTVKQRLDDAMKLLMLIVTLHQTTTLGAISRTLDTTVMSVSRVEGLVLEVGNMRAQLARSIVLMTSASVQQATCTSSSRIPPSRDRDSARSTCAIPPSLFTAPLSSPPRFNGPCLHHSVPFTTLALLERLKTRFPGARGSTSHRLFLSAFTIASTVVSDDVYSNKAGQ